MVSAEGACFLSFLSIVELSEMLDPTFFMFCKVDVDKAENVIE